MQEPAEFSDAHGLVVGLLGVSLGATVTGAVWWNFATGPRATWHPGVLGVVLTPLALGAAAWCAVRLVRLRAR